ncbi:MAG: ABC transporter permease [bacterium]|nr:ABC transporter permease [bacterium]
MSKAVQRIGFALVPVLISLLITALIIVIAGADPLAVFQSVLEGAFRSTSAFGGVVNFWIPLALCSMGLIVTFTAGLWNIGVEGQMVMGAIAASGVARSLGESLPNEALIPLEILAAMIGGGGWALIVGILKTRLGVHEIFGGVALNALANVYAIYLISGPWTPPEGGSAQSTSPFPTAALYQRASGDFPVSLLGLGIALAAILLVALALRGTRWGLHLKATGKNAKSALLLGVPTVQSALTAFMVCGALAGIAGSYRALLTYGSLRPFISGGIGFLALLVVLVAASRPVWTTLIALIFAVILGGSTRLRVALQLDQSLAGVLQGTVVLLVLLANGLRQRLAEPRRPRKEAPRATVERQRSVIID